MMSNPLWSAFLSPRSSIASGNLGGLPISRPVVGRDDWTIFHGPAFYRDEYNAGAASESAQAWSAAAHADTGLSDRHAAGKRAAGAAAAPTDPATAHVI
jgi:hypothetical protein